MKQCKGVIARQDPLEPIGRCGARTDRSYCPRCAQDPSQGFWNEVLKPGWDKNVTSTVDRLLTAPEVPSKPRPKPRPTSKPKRKKPPHKTAYMSREEARKLLLGG